MRQITSQREPYSYYRTVTGAGSEKAEVCTEVTLNREVSQAMFHALNEVQAAVSVLVFLRVTADTYRACTISGRLGFVLHVFSYFLFYFFFFFGYVYWQRRIGS